MLSSPGLDAPPIQPWFQHVLRGGPVEMASSGSLLPAILFGRRSVSATCFFSPQAVGTRDQ
eukprot:2500592-Pyramimonas_sp.AAC.1